MKDNVHSILVADQNPAEPEPDGNWLPIREVARQTGVNAVTLRAWERRYGLIVPHRTPKGHRLYSDEHVQRVLNILTWLNRGVSVSQVKNLIDSRQPHTSAPGNDWQALRLNLMKSIAELAERRVDDVFNQAMSLYPPRTLCEQLLMPLLSELECRWQSQFGGQMERAFFYSWLRSKLGARIYHNNRQLNGAPMLLVNHSDLPLEPMLWLSAWLISSADCPVEVFDWPLPNGELALAVEYLKPRAVLLYSSKALNPGQLSKLLSNVGCPMVLAGASVRIHCDDLDMTINKVEGLPLAEDPLGALAALQLLDLF